MVKPHEMTLVVHRETSHSRPEVRDETATPLALVYVAYRTEGQYSVPQHKDAAAVAALFAAAPDMARVALALKTRGEECLNSLPGKKSLDDLAIMDITISVPASVLRDALAALRKAGVIP